MDIVNIRTNESTILILVKKIEKADSVEMQKEFSRPRRGHSNENIAAVAQSVAEETSASTS